MTEIYNTNLINVSACYLKLLNVRVTAKSLRQQLVENPFYPSLYSLNNVFERLHLDTTAFKTGKENFEKLQPPFIAYMSGETTGKDFVVVIAVSQNEVEYIAENKKPKKVAKEAFLKRWLEIVLIAQANEKSGEADFDVKRNKEINTRNKRNALTGTGIFILAASIYLFLYSSPAGFMMNAVVLLLIKIAGITVTTLLLVYEIDNSNAFVKALCTAGKQKNCSAVLNSKASKILGISLSEAGFFYFAATFLFLLFPSINFASKVFVLSVASCIAATYILFSIYYQWKVLKQWCPLCLTVQFVLSAELTWSVINFLHQPFLPLIGYNVIFIAFYLLLIPITAWYLIKPLILKSKEEPVHKAAYKRLLYNPDTFNHLLQQQATAPEGYQNIGITVGNPAAENTIIKVCNPYCGPCAKVHPVLDEIIHNNKNIKLKLIFTATNDSNDKRGIAARHLLAINAKYDANQTQQALDDWYLVPKKNYEAFAAKYPMNGEINQQELEIEKMKAWCKEAAIMYTPTIFINGKHLPENYKIDQLKYIL